VQTLLMKHVEAGKVINFIDFGNGAMRAKNRMRRAITARRRTPAGQPGGGIAPPINTPDPLSKYKWWILGGWHYCWRLLRLSCCASRGGCGNGSGFRICCSGNACDLHYARHNLQQRTSRC